MKYLFFYLLVLYVAEGFSLLFLERPQKPLRAAFLMFFGPVYTIVENIKLALGK